MQLMFDVAEVLPFHHSRVRSSMSCPKPKRRSCQTGPCDQHEYCVRERQAYDTDDQSWWQVHGTVFLKNEGHQRKVGGSTTLAIRIEIEMYGGRISKRRANLDSLALGYIL